MQTATESYTRYFWWFVIIHAILWMILPACLRYALPHDTIEGALWGQHLEWGYDKNPWMNAWLTRLGWVIGGTSGVGIYALSSIFTGISLWAVWKLAGKFFSPLSALVSVMLLEGCINYTLVPQSFNDNLLELALWPLMFLYFYEALQDQKMRDWLFTGIFAALAMMTKYYSAVPLACMLIFLLTTKEGRRSFRHAGIYASLAIFIAIILPHIVWLFKNQFLPIAYALNRTDLNQASIWRTHIYFPLSFAWAQLLDFILPVFLLLIFARRKSATAELNNYNKYFLYITAIGPYILTLLLAVLFGWRLYNEWGVPLVSLWGILLIYWFKPEITTARFKKFVVIIYIIMFLWAVGYAVGLYIPSKNKHSDNYPAQEIATYVTDAWRSAYHKPLKYVAGSRYVGGYIAFYSKDHPSVYVEWNKDFSPWINIKDMQKYGAVFVQDNYYGTTVFGTRPYTANGMQFPPEVLKQFPIIKILPVRYFAWHRGNKHLPPVPVLIAFLPPAS